MMIWFPLLLVLILLCPFNSIAATQNLNRLKPTLFTDGKSSSKQSSKPTNDLFQVTKPIDVPSTVPCKQLLLQHEFSSTDGKPQVVTNYAGPPSKCGSQQHHYHQGFSKIVLESSGTLKGTQDDAVFGVWLGGVELLRSSPAQGYNTSAAWSAQKDITRYSSLLLKKEKQKLVVFFRTTTDSGYIGAYRITISISFYPHDHKSLKSIDHQLKLQANLILPISRNLDSGNGLWFQIKNSTDVKVKKFHIPRNAYRAVLEVYVSSHSFDQSWYSNYPAEYYNSNQLEDPYGNGPFRDVVITVDDVVAGAVWPYPLMSNAGLDMWNPVTIIRSFDLPSYDVELTPFLGTLLDGGVHNLSFSIGNALSVWYVNANLHLWLDQKSSVTKGKLLSTYSQPLDLSSTVGMKGVLLKSWVEAHRIVSSRGWVQSSHGNITTHVNQNLSYTNYKAVDIEDKIFLFTLHQLISSNDSSVSFVSAHDHASPDSIYSSVESMKSFSVVMKDEKTEVGGGDVSVERNVEIGYSTDEKTTSDESKSVVTSSLRDEQSGNIIWTRKNNMWIDPPLGGMNQSYIYQKIDHGDDSIKVCYFRKINTSNASIVHDKEDWKC